MNLAIVLAVNNNRFSFCAGMPAGSFAAYHGKSDSLLSFPMDRFSD